MSKAKLKSGLQKSGPRTKAQKDVTRQNVAKARAVRAEKIAKQPITTQMMSFVDAYILNNGNGAAAARQAGYSFPAIKAGALLSNPKIKEALVKRREELMAKMTATPERVIAEHEAVGFSNLVKHLLALSKKDQLKALESLSADDQHVLKTVNFDPETGRIVKLELHAKASSLASLQSILGMDQPQNINVQTAISVTLARDILEAAYRVLPDSETKQIENQTDAAFDVEAASKLLGEK